MKKVFLGILVIVLGFGTISFTTSSNDIAKPSVDNQNQVQVNAAFGATYTIPWNSCCESPLIPIERDIVQRGLPIGTYYTIKSTTVNSVTYTIF
ncbi:MULTISPECIES: hypothetical protein [unclassified Flavobacterium]|jgi:hypothetical protein|uniref:hypothetical protein n=1 Tax=unclassified Flavobacterium TaxID=196869 RepID=UPI0012A9FB3B|nr:MULTISPECIES: hypothetical protein [unclassified Flavobacterium]MBF4486798.1 hypothetical protein [Flavobacterium sp. CSZ]QGK76418.1 hypothetical protein GIY83_20790 [Flavobacterium sp. SLB02]